jgi:hypothetical protein
LINRDLHRNRIDANNPLTNTAGYGVSISRVNVTGPAWRAVYVHHLSPQENGNQHNVFIDCLDSMGYWANASRLKVAYTWEGRRPDEAAPPRPFEKKPPEPRAQLDINKGQKITCWIDDPTLPSDRVVGLRSDVQDVPGNNLFHNSFVVLFQLQQGGAVEGPTEPDGDLDDLRREVAALRVLVTTQGNTIAQLGRTHEATLAVLGRIEGAL